MLNRPPEWLLVDHVRQHGRNHPSRTALIAGDSVLTWLEVAARMIRGAAWLMSRGVRAGDRVACLVGDGACGVVATLAAWRAGAVAVPLSPMLTPEQIRAVLADAGVSVLIADRAQAGAAQALGDAVATVCTEFESDCADLPLERTLADEAAEPPHPPDLPATLIYSSGTTGAPKGIEHSARARLHMAQGTAIALRVDERSTALIATPIASNASWLLLLPCLLVGATVVWMPAFHAGSWWLALKAQRVTHAFGVPLMWRRILAEAPPEWIGEKPPGLKVLLSAGSALPVNMKRALAERFGPVVFELYGCTEGVATLLPPECPDSKLDTVGQAMLGTEVAVLSDDGRRAGAGQLGEVVGRSFSMMNGYFRRPAETREAVWTDETGADWIRTGDIGSLDESGYLSIKDRKKDMILSGGQNVYPADLEAILMGHPDVLETAVLGMAHETWGEVPGALVRLHPDRHADEEQLMAWANARLAKHQRLHRVRFTAEPLPRNALGKVLKIHLRQSWHEGVR